MSFLRYTKVDFGYTAISSLKWLVISACVTFSIYSCDTTESVKPYQDQSFIKLYGGNGTEEGKDVIVLPDGGFLLVGSTTSGSNGGKDVYVVRTDELGNVVWEILDGGSGDDVGNAAILGQNGSVYVCGEITQDTSSIMGLRDVYVMNINLNDGSILGKKRYGEAIRDEFGMDILELVGGGFFITSTMLHSDTSKYYLIETDGNLDTLDNRSRYIGTEEVNNYAITSFENTNDLGNPFVCFGTVQRTVNENESFWFRSFIYRSNSDATTNPEFYGSEDGNEFVTSTYRTIDGGFVLSGYEERGGTVKEMVVKINPNREESWKQIYTNEFNENVQETDIIQTLDGGFMVSSTIELDDPRNNEICLLKLNSTGQEEWRKTYGSNDDDFGSKVVQLENGSYVVVGTMGFEINPESRSKMCLMKVNPNGDLAAFD